MPAPDKSSRCWATSAMYSITCLPCSAKGRLTQYWGESGLTSYSRGISHWTGLERRAKQSVLHQHSADVHGGQNHQLHPEDFAMSVVQSHRSSLPRQVQEGTIISNQLKLRDREVKCKVDQPRLVLNSKTEFNQPGMVQPRASRILY